MATRRMLSKEISHSLQVSKLSLSAKLLFTWMIPHADDDGRLKGEAVYLKATIVPMINWTVPKIEEYISEIHKMGLIYYWKVNDEQFIEFIKWTDHQHIRKDRYTPSKLPSFVSQSSNQMSTTSKPSCDHLTPELNINEKNIDQIKKVELNDNSANEGKDNARKKLVEKGILR